MAYQPLATFDFKRLFIPAGDAAVIAEQNKKSLVSKGKQMTQEYLKKESEYLSKPMPDPRTKEGAMALGNMVSGFVGGGLKNVAKPLLVKAGDKTVELFHGTYKSSANKIIKEGFKLSPG